MFCSKHMHFRIQIFNIQFCLLPISVHSKGLQCWLFMTETAAKSLYNECWTPVTIILKSFPRYLSVLINGHDEANSNGWQATVMQFYPLLFDRGTIRSSQWKPFICLDSRKLIFYGKWLQMLCKANFVRIIQVITIAYHWQICRFSGNPGLSDCIENSK